jgi:hypothetical protein
LSNPILGRQDFSRLPLQRRPVADPGTTLVFVTRRGELVSAENAYTMGELWWRGPRAVYRVDTTRHGQSFDCRLPARGDVLHFDAQVSFSWSVQDASAVVRDQVTSGEVGCRDHLIKEMRRICRRVDPMEREPAERAERAIHAELGQSKIVLPNGLCIDDLHVVLSLDPEQASIAKELLIGTLRQQRDVMSTRGHDDIENIKQTGELRRKRERIAFYEDVVGNKLLANVLAEDPAKAAETVQLIFSMEQQNREKAIQAMQVIIDGGHLQIGDLDPAIAAVVSQFTSLVSHVSSTIAGTPQAASRILPASSHADPGAPPIVAVEAAEGEGETK